MVSKEWSCSMNWKKVHLKQLKWCFTLMTQFYWSPENALYACFIAKRWRWVWLEMLQLTTQLWKNASTLYSLNPAWSINNISKISKIVEISNATFTNCLLQSETPSCTFEHSCRKNNSLFYPHNKIQSMGVSAPGWCAQFQHSATQASLSKFTAGLWHLAPCVFKFLCAVNFTVRLVN